MVSDYFRMSGSIIEKRADGSYRLINGDFTTCIHGRPDYRLQVKDLTIRPDKVAKAHNIRLFLGGFALPPIPYLTRNIGTSSNYPLPFPGYDRTNGPNLHFVYSPTERANRTFDLNLFVNLKRLPTGIALFQQDIGSGKFRSRRRG